MTDTGEDSTTPSATSPASTKPSSGTVDNRDRLKPRQWDRSGAGEIEDGSPSAVGADPRTPHNDSKTSAGV